MQKFLNAFLLASLVLVAESSAAEKLFPDGAEISLSIVNHASFALKTSKLTLLADPVGGGEKYKEFGSPDLILITDIHGDHMEPATLKALAGEKTIIVAPKAVIEKLPADLQSKTQPLANGETKTFAGVQIEAVPMYNLTADRLKFHDKGRRADAS